MAGRQQGGFGGGTAGGGYECHQGKEYSQFSHTTIVAERHFYGPTPNNGWASPHREVSHLELAGDFAFQEVQVLGTEALDFFFASVAEHKVVVQQVVHVLVASDLHRF